MMRISLLQLIVKYNKILRALRERGLQPVYLDDGGCELVNVSMTLPFPFVEDSSWLKVTVRDETYIGSWQREVKGFTVDEVYKAFAMPPIVRWIALTDEKPPMGEPVLMKAEKNHMSVCVAKRFTPDKHGFEFYDQDERALNATPTGYTHWMRIPA